MTAAIGAAALLCTAMGLVAAAAVLAATRDVRRALPVLLEFLTAAGLLRLGMARGWQALAAAAAIVLVRRLLVLGLRQRPALAGAPPTARPVPPAPLTRPSRPR